VIFNLFEFTWYDNNIYKENINHTDQFFNLAATVTNWQAKYFLMKILKHKHKNVLINIVLKSYSTCTSDSQVY
jgi:hypothetical protein